jgi:hypothetical protein
VVNNFSEVLTESDGPCWSLLHCISTTFLVPGFANLLMHRTF